jgi:hypothetical protein
MSRRKREEPWRYEAAIAEVETLIAQIESGELDLAEVVGALSTGRPNPEDLRGLFRAKAAAGGDHHRAIGPRGRRLAGVLGIPPDHSPCTAVAILLHYGWSLDGCLYPCAPMPAKILDGKALAARLQAEMAAQVQAWIPQVGRPPGLAVLRVGEDPASAAYVRGKERACERLGIASFGRHFSAQDSPAPFARHHRPTQSGRAGGWHPRPTAPAPRLGSHPPPSGHQSRQRCGWTPSPQPGRLLRGEPGLRSCTPLA